MFNKFFLIDFIPINMAIIEKINPNTIMGNIK